MEPPLGGSTLRGAVLQWGSGGPSPPTEATASKVRTTASRAQPQAHRLELELDVQALAVPLRPWRHAAQGVRDVERAARVDQQVVVRIDEALPVGRGSARGQGGHLGAEATGVAGDPL